MNPTLPRPPAIATALPIRARPVNRMELSAGWDIASPRVDPPSKSRSRPISPFPDISLLVIPFPRRSGGRGVAGADVADVAEPADAAGLKPASRQRERGFDPLRPHHSGLTWQSGRVVVVGTVFFDLSQALPNFPCRTPTRTAPQPLCIADIASWLSFAPHLLGQVRETEHDSDP